MGKKNIFQKIVRGAENIGKTVLGDVGKVAPLVAPFLPGPWGVAAGALGGLLQEGQQQGQANAVAGQQNAAAGVLTGLATQNLPLVTQAMLTNSGIDPKTGAYNASYNPYQPLIDQYYSPGAITGRAGTLYNSDQLVPQMVAQQETTDKSYDNAVDAAKTDVMNRGFANTNSLTPSAITQIRLGQASSNAAGRRSLLSDLLAQKNAYVQQQQNQGQNVALQGFNVRQQNQGELGSLLSGSAQQGLGTLGGLRGFYADQASTTGKGVGDLIGQAATAGTLPKFDPRTILGNKNRVGTPPFAPSPSSPLVGMDTAAGNGVGWGWGDSGAATSRSVTPPGVSSPSVSGLSLSTMLQSRLGVPNIGGLIPAGQDNGGVATSRSVTPPGVPKLATGAGLQNITPPGNIGTPMPPGRLSLGSVLNRNIGRLF